MLLYFDLWNEMRIIGSAECKNSDEGNRRHYQ